MRVGGADPGLTDEPAALAEAARRHLRQKFLRSQVAITGANFAIAETGTLGVVESEGNGRMCLTLPRLLIALDGDREAAADLARPRGLPAVAAPSGHRRADEPLTRCGPGAPGDGPGLHLVLLTTAAPPPWPTPRATALRCIRCSACLNVCPVYERAGGHAYGRCTRGRRRRALPQLTGGADDPVAALRLDAVRRVLRRLPGRHRHPLHLVRLRKESVDARGRSAEATAMGAAAWAMSSSRRWALVLRLARVGRLLGRRRGVIRQLPPPLSSWTARRDLPRPPRQSLREWWAQEHTGE